MRRTYPVRIGDLWADFLSSAPTVALKIAHAKVIDVWPEIVGPVISTYTRSISFEKGIMFVHISSASARHALFLQRKEILNRLNEKLGVRVANDIIIR